ncbi:EamA family transporter [Massilia sp. ST3]|uniref:EamA family transporter n=1 Tax=Massilia sp. ST3 TaxID=2824903 RepID=UPI001B82F070|nr:EamA family transporter [Massilia sp. ST3]MBQ5950472.1 EamA family transporter [Massilia sp. ST3]
MHPRHLLAAVGIVAIWGFNFVVIKLGLKDLPPLLLCALRFTLAALPAVFFVKRPEVPFGMILTYGLVMFGVQFAFLFGGMYLGVSAGLASLSLQLQSFITIGLAAWLLGERPTRFQIGGAVLAFSGIALVAANLGGDVSAPGLLAVILAALAWACGNLLSKRLGKVNMFALVVWGSLVVPIPMFALSLLVEGPARIAGGIARMEWSTVAALAYLVYPTTLLGFAVWSRLLALYPAASIAPLTLLVPVFGMASSVLVLEEGLQPWKVAAFVLVILGLGVNLFGARLMLRARGVRP